MEKSTEIRNNGLAVAAKPMSHMESISLGIWIKAGARYENRNNNGISHLLEHLLFKGTETRGMREIKEAIEGRGGSFNGFTSEEVTCYLVKLLAKDAELGVEILSDMVLNPKLDEKEIEKEKSVIVEEINMYRDIPAQHVHEILTEMLWPDQPLGMPLAGTPESVNSTHKRDVDAYKNTFYNPNNMLLIGVGRIKEGKLLSLAGKYLSRPARQEPVKFEKAVNDQREPLLKVAKKDTEQTHMALAFHAMNRLSPDRYAASILNVILGANMSSRLFHVVRDELALCYEISSSVRKYEDAGAFVIGAGLDESNLIKALEVIFKELNRIKSEPIPDEELNRAKEFYKGQLLFTMEDTMSRMLWLGEKIISKEKELDVKKIVDRIARINKDDIMRVAGTIFKNESMNLAVIGPVKDESGLKGVLHL
ncbi:MAG: pitrilysin family protein [Candidatus Omnitrophota bacterium]|nr:pitrilysin family protein [Candidatus Omnitrophota bacterium]